MNDNENKFLINSIDRLNKTLLDNKIIDLIELLGNFKKLLIRNLISGISKGIGIGIGFTIISAIIIFVLQKIITLNIPILSQYISDIIDIIQSSK